MDAPGVTPEPTARALRKPPEGELEAALAEHLPGFDFVDQDLELARSGRRADLVAVDRAGRVALILVVDGETSESSLAALEALAFARTHATVLARHLGPYRAYRDRPPQTAPLEAALVVLVAESFTSAVVESLAVFAAEDLHLFAVREIKSAAGARAYLVPVEIAARPRTPAPTLDDFLSALPPGARSAAEIAIRRIERIDGELERGVEDGAVRWRWRERDLCALTRARERVEGTIASGGTIASAGRIAARGAIAAGCETAVLDLPGALEPFLDRVVRAYTRLAGRAAEAEDGDPEHSNPAPLLTPAEIAAFHE